MNKTNDWPMVELGELVKKTNETKGDSDIPVYSVTKHSGFVSDYFKKDVHSKDQSKYKVVNEGEFAYATIHLDEGSIGIAPEKAAVSPMYTTFRIASPDVDPQFLLRFLKSNVALSQYAILGTGSIERRKNINFEAFSRLTVPLPPLAEQQRIAEMLNFSQQQLHLLETKRADLDSLKTESVDQVLDLNDRKTLPLKEIVEIQSGITKGRKVREGETLTETPYMAVSNVKDGYLDLQNVKTLPVTEAETTRFSLQAGDILLTEGGDPDKLGRGTVWREEIETCLHQNHIFRVRLPEDSQFTPEVLMAMLATKQARAYFFRSAKQTTGIASINKTQLSAVPVPVLTSEEIAKLSKLLNQVDAITEDLEKRQESSEELHNSLSTRAFAGQL
ncbi:hypothetical protein EKI50_04395 [Corynebacterium sanguinis]|uniref:restriction endonuclease subunit S n=1 Tax=Corynebacterium sanguinis TaxID=2594913 RepID=UPI0011A6B441|nr:restriction endonuclease subunit S [Corynebacterium sanguinis]TVS22987.1 hypothetical protein EKI50_04395 [Corynebacterium sanguinis]